MSCLVHSSRFASFVPYRLSSFPPEDVDALVEVVVAAAHDEAARKQRAANACGRSRAAQAWSAPAERFLAARERGLASS